jgi:pSer/pThr/pTyr-binding forkhead associated (FHA) protein
MAFLKHRTTGEQHSLSSRHVVGRSPTSNLHLTNRLASGTHAEILWNGSTWELRDLASRNGTFVGTARLASGERAPLRLGNVIAFGDAEDLFELVDDGPPSAVAISDDEQRQESEDGYLILPDAERPVLTIFEEGGGNWVAESNDGTRRRISNGDTLRTEAQLWRIELPVILEGTWQPGAQQVVLHRATMRFVVSRDEEKVEASLIQDHQVVALGSRSHHYLLLTLARARLADQARLGVAEADVGWVYVPDLFEMLKSNETNLNVAICRARKDLKRANVFGASDIIERQAATRRIRLGVQKIEILAV